MLSKKSASAGLAAAATAGVLFTGAPAFAQGSPALTHGSTAYVQTAQPCWGGWCKRPFHHRHHFRHHFRHHRFDHFNRFHHGPWGWGGSSWGGSGWGGSSWGGGGWGGNQNVNRNVIGNNVSVGISNQNNNVATARSGWGP